MKLHLLEPTICAFGVHSEAGFQMSANLDLVKGTYDAFANGDIDTVLAAFADDII